jgi:hypothetical protein
MIKTMVEQYINDEIEYIKEGFGYTDHERNEEEIKKDLEYLNGLADKDITEIANLVENDSELWEKIYQITHYYLYHRKEYTRWRI